MSVYFSASIRMERYTMHGPSLVFSFRRLTLNCLQPSGGLQSPPRLHRWSRLHLPRNPRRMMERTSTWINMERHAFFPPIVSGFTTMPIACWNWINGICFVIRLPLSPDPFPQLMVMQDTTEPGSARVEATGSGDGGSGSTSQVGDPFRYLSACRCSISKNVICINFLT